MKYDVDLNSAAHLPAAGIVELACLAEEAGFQAYWKGQTNSADPVVLLGAIAARTRTLEIGTAVAHIYGSSAITLGTQAATLQDLSGGRFLLGLGVGNRTIAAWHSGTFDRPLRRVREYLEIVRKTAAGERVEYQGEIYSTGKRFQLAWTPSHPAFPIYLAALGPQMTRLAGRIADGVFLNMTTPAMIRKIVARVREGAISAGRDPEKIEILAKVRVSLNPDRALARSRLRQVLTFYNIADHYTEMLQASGFEAEVSAIQEAYRAGGFKAAMRSLTDDYMDRLPAIPATSIEELRERLLPFVEAGVTRLVLPYAPATEPAIEDARRFLEAWRKTL